MFSSLKYLLIVSFQGYPQEFLSVTVTGIPSMHICLDFVPELLRQPEIEKQVMIIQRKGFIFNFEKIFLSIE